MRKTMSFPRRELPPLARIKQNLPGDHVKDVRGDVYRKLIEAKRHDINPGSRIAITAGSRGMGGFVELLNGIVDALKSVGAEPFIIPAMGSHGGATPEGQLEILKRLGVTDESVAAPVKATMQTQALGTSKTGAIAHLDTIAAEADGIVVLGRTKTHPENKEGVASGLLKMVTVGLGKQIGAQEAHTHGLWPSVEAVPELTMAKAKILCGVAVVENGFRQPVEIEVVPPKYEAFKDADERLLLKAKPHFANIPFQQLDVLVVDQLGKNISGTGMDLNVIGNWRMNGGAHDPDFRRIAVLSLTSESLGNGLGIGLADFTTQRFVDEYDPAVTYVNLLTATEPGAMNSMEGPLPLALANDREAIEVALFSSLGGPQPRVCRIRNTAYLDEMWVSEALLPEVEENEKMSVLDKVEPVDFDARGNLF
ncbi:MAG TPA: hypothetical protein VE863_02070 [Pyrinomonadaceae bacterium]|jgi:hypothetical protein|nr:hypothetical protein [Pyrinomonadaceae bacterium]